MIVDAVMHTALTNTTDTELGTKCRKKKLRGSAWMTLALCHWAWTWMLGESWTQKGLHMPTLRPSDVLGELQNPWVVQLLGHT